jgi:alanyl-tRNA synthetase
LEQQKVLILETLETEKNKFILTLEKGELKLFKVLEQCKHNSVKSIDASVVFMLFDTYGFPPEITEELAMSHKIGHTSTNIYAEIFEYFKKNFKYTRKSFETIEKKLEGNETEDAKKLLKFILAFKDEFSKIETKLKELEKDFHSYAYEKKKYAELSEEKLNQNNVRPHPGLKPGVCKGAALLGTLQPGLI